MKSFFNFLLSFIFPLSSEDRLLQEQIEALTSEELLRIAPGSLHLPDEEMLTALNYQNKYVKEIIWRLKYKAQKQHAALLAECLYPLLIEALSEKKLFENFTDPIMIPIPLSKKRMRERGFNQCELLAKEMSLIDGTKNFTIDTSVLYRIKDNEHQARIKDKRARFENSKQTFTILNKTAITNRNIILLDDVITSGATILSAKNELRKAGARKVFMVSIAH
jgi:competence protein ComFC